MSGNSLGNLGVGQLAPPTLQGGISNSQSGLYNQYMSQGQMNATLAQQQYNRAYGVAGLGQQMYRPRWMIDGREMSMEAFANELFGDDTPEKTLFLLKYSKGE